MWIYLGTLAAVILGLYNLCNKHSVNNNAVLPVLWTAMLISVLCMCPIYILSRSHSTFMENQGFFIPVLNWIDHGYIAIKAVIMSISWLLAFYAIKHLPVTIVAPMRSTGPFFTLLGALAIFQENPSPMQWLGFTFIIISMMLYSRVGKKEGLDFKRNKWIYAILLATALSAGSGLYDKFLLQYRHYAPQTVLLWFTFYVVVILGICLIFVWYPQRKKSTPFKWRWSLPFVGIFMVASDFVYYKALQDPKALITILSAIRLSNILIVVLVGGIIFKEQNKRQKLIPLLGMMIGVALILYSA